MTLKKQVRRRIGGDSLDLQRYRNPFIKEANSKWSASEMRELLSSLETAHVVFMGDFHPLQQSQK
ncbi:MAG TPA: hypothetical protein PLJ21_08930, partial [Pseudobdellovibrionaceae bacterium]|nr:hypothetical protein [Pseudobdellovibrionaceae bacterium]